MRPVAPYTGTTVLHDEEASIEVAVKAHDFLQALGVPCLFLAESIVVLLELFDPLLELVEALVLR